MGLVEAGVCGDALTSAGRQITGRLKSSCLARLQGFCGSSTCTRSPSRSDSACVSTTATGFGGGQGGDLDNFGDRVDIDAVAFWEIRNLGLGERAARNRARARMQQAELEQIRRMDEVASEIVQAHAQVRARQRQIALAEQAVQSAVDGQGLPIEVLQPIHALDQTRREYLRTVVAYNESQFRLQRSLGWPVR